MSRSLPHVAIEGDVRAHYISHELTLGWLNTVKKIIGQPCRSYHLTQCLEIDGIKEHVSFDKGAELNNAAAMTGISNRKLLLRD